VNDSRSVAAVACLVDAGRGEQGGTRSTCEVGASSTTRPVVAAPDPGDRERHPGRLVVEREPLLVQPAVGAEQVAVVGGAHDHGVVGAAVGDGPAHPVERAVDLGVQPVVGSRYCWALLR
jgi:hypothetical protein